MRCIPDLTAENQFEKLPAVEAAKGKVAKLLNESSRFLAELGYQRQENGAYRILKRNRDVSAFLVVFSL